MGEVHRALCINIMPHSAPSIGISSALNFYIQGRGEVGERKCFQSRNNSAVEEFSRCRSRRNWIFWILSIRIFIGSKPQIPNGLHSKEAVGRTRRIGNLGLVIGQIPVAFGLLLFKIFFATTQKYILFLWEWKISIFLFSTDSCSAVPTWFRIRSRPCRCTHGQLIFAYFQQTSVQNLGRTFPDDVPGGTHLVFRDGSASVDGLPIIVKYA